MQFDPSKYGARVARILAYDGAGQRLMPLTCGPCSSPQARAELRTIRPEELFPDAPHLDASMAGLWLYFSCFEEAHQIADACPAREGELWHAILHRQEPDSGNAAYWFRKAGTHAIFPELAQEADQIINRIPDAEFRIGKWDPYDFITFCERARLQPGSAQERAALEIQRVEWQLLFDHCAKSRAHKLKIAQSAGVRTVSGERVL
jgi:hypothetical protein